MRKLTDKSSELKKEQAKEKADKLMYDYFVRKCTGVICTGEEFGKDSDWVINSLIEMLQKEQNPKKPTIN